MQRPGKIADNSYMLRAARLARKGFTLVEIMIVVLIIGILLGIAVPSWMKIRQTTRIKACHENIRLIDNAKQQWAMDQGKEASDVADQSELAPEYIKDFPTCPEGGTYTIGPHSTPSSCSIHGQLPQ